MSGSLAYRKNEAAILRGEVPEKYTRLLPHIPGGRIVELGAAEGVLSLLLAKRGDSVTAIERNSTRHAASIRLARAWGVPNAIFACGDILDLCKEDDATAHPLDHVDTLVAVRMIYYLRENIDAVFFEIAKRVPRVVLCGNRNRADNWRRGTPHAPLGEFNRYAALEGMRDLLVRHGYRIMEEVTDGDEIVVGVLD